MLVVFLSFFLFELILLPHYGTDWDTINHLPRGQAYLRYILTGEQTYEKLPDYVDYYQEEDTLLFSPSQPKESIPKRSLYQIDGYGASYFLEKDGGHPPLSDIFSSVFNFVLFQEMRLINDIDSYHVYIIAVASLLVAALFWWTRKHYGIFVAFVTILSLVLYPLFLGESRFNLKDIPQASFYSLMIIFLYEGITRKKNLFLILSAVFFGFAWGTKFNILFSPFIILPWLIVYLKQKTKSFKEINWLIPSIFFFPLIAIAIFWGSWPYLWAEPINNFFKIVDYYKTIGINPNFDPSFTFFGFNTFAIQWIIYTTPLVTLFLTLFGVLYTLSKGRSEKQKTAFLVLLWFLIPIARVTVPNAGIYGGVRQIMEFIPAMAILSGIGAGYIVKLLYFFIVERLKQFNNRTMKQSKERLLTLVLQILIVLMFIPITLKLISIHPNQNVYFNPLIGGLEGTKDKNFPYLGNSFGNAYRQGIHWINEHAQNGSTLVLAQELMPNLPKLFVRSDLKYTNSLRSGYIKKGEYVIGLNYGSELNTSYYSSRYYYRYLKPIYQIKVDNVSILNIWKNDLANTKKGFDVEETVSDLNYENSDNGILIDLKKPTYISKIQWSFSTNNCKSADQIYFNISVDGENWYKTPHVLPQDLPIPILERQPVGNTISYPFAAEYARYINIVLDPKESCPGNVETMEVFHLPKVNTSQSN